MSLTPFCKYKQLMLSKKNDEFDMLLCLIRKVQFELCIYEVFNYVL